MKDKIIQIETVYNDTFRRVEVFALTSTGDIYFKLMDDENSKWVKLK